MEKYKAQRHQYYLATKESKLEYQREYAKSHKEEISVYQKEYSKAHKEEIRRNHARWQERHGAERNKEQKERRDSDPLYKLLGNYRNRLRRAIQSNFKSGHTIELLGCSIEFLKKHLENQFKSGMSWQNYGKGRGKWSIDHIIPCDSFDLMLESEQRECFHYSNLQPLWNEENSAKRARV